MDCAEHISRLEREASALAAVLQEVADAGGLAQVVPSCPAWTVRDLAEHTGGLYRWATALVDTPITTETWRLELPIEYPQRDADVAGWFAASIGPMVDAFASAPPDRRVWAWGVDPHARFWARRMLHETVVHGADLALTIGRPAVIDAELAVDGIDEFLTNLPATARWGAPTDRWRGDGETLGVRAADHPEAWRLRFDTSGLWCARIAATPADPATPANATDATLAGPVADLYLSLQGRDRSAVEQRGAPSVIERFRSGLDF